MKARFVLDESSWIGAARAKAAGALTNAIERLLERLDVARKRGEGVVMHADYYQTDLGDGVQLLSVMFEPGCSVHLDHDVALRLAWAIEQASEFDESRLVTTRLHSTERAGSRPDWGGHTLRAERDIK